MAGKTGGSGAGANAILLRRARAAHAAAIMPKTKSSAAAPVRAWFPTQIYCAPLRSGGAARFNADLADECRQLREFDAEGRKWCEKNYPGGYTSYASLNRLHTFSSTFEGLEKAITRHVRAFAKSLDMDLRGREIHMTDCWVNIMPETAAHSMHLHPNSFISGTYYVVTPAGCPGLKFEDPRLSSLMAAPPKLPNVRDENRLYTTYPAEAGNVILFESWLRHEVAQNRTKEERISISFNYAWS